MQCLVALVLTSTSGCGGCNPIGSAGHKIREVKFSEGSDDAPTPPKKPVAPLVARTTPPPVAPGAGAGAAAKKTKKPARPKDVTEWKRDDYYSARRDGDPQLVAAVSYLGMHFSGKPSAAELLIRLLEGVPATTDSEEPRPKARGTDTQLVEAIVAALAVNGTPLAWQTIEQLAAGNLKTSDNPAAAPAALKALLGRPGQESEDSLLRVVALAGQPPPIDGSRTDLKGQRSTLLALMKSSASASLRLRLANYMIAPETPQSWYDQLWACLQEPRPENLAAQSALYQSNRPDDAAKRLLEQRLIAGGSIAVGRLLGTIPPPERSPAAGTAAAADPSAVTEHLWSASLAATIERRLATIDSLDQGARLVLLASTIPDQRVRAALSRALKMHWQEDPMPLAAAGAAEKMTPEPGFLMLVKMLPHKDAASCAASNAALDRGGTPHAPSGKTAKTVKTVKAAAIREAKLQRERISQQWVRFAETLLRAMCRQFRAAAMAPEPSSGRARAGSNGEDVPLKLHSAADVVATYRWDWPDGLGGKPAGLHGAPLRVRYVRIEQQARAVKVLAYYRRQLPDCEEHPIEQGIWLDALASTTEEAAARSIDVLITKASNNLPGLADQEQRLIVEILAVDCAGIGAKGLVSTGK